MGKPKKRASGGSGLRKNHGPKRHMYKELKPMIHIFGKVGALDKYSSEEAFVMACQARGVKSPLHSDWVSFYTLKTKKEKDAWFAALKK